MSSSPLKYSDTDFLAGFRSGDDRVIGAFYAEYFPRILNMIRSNQGNEDDARDIFQEAILVLYQRSRDPEFRLTSALYTYLYSVCRNLWLKKLRKSGREGVMIEGDVVSNDEEGLAQAQAEHEQYQLFRSKFVELSDSCRKLIGLFLGGKKAREVMEIMGYKSEQFVRKKKFECKERLVKLIRNSDEFEAAALGRKI